MKAAKAIPALTEKDKARFWSKVDKNGPLPDQSNPHYAGLDQCWVWTAGKSRLGYGRINIGGIVFNSHRVSFVESGGIFEGGNDQVLHLCDFPACNNPSHLRQGTNAANMADMAAKGRSGAKKGVSTTPMEKRSRGDRHSEIMHRVAAKGDRNGSRTKPERVRKGEGNGRAKITANDVIEIRERFSKGGVFKWQIALDYGVSRVLVGKIINRKLWKHVA